MPIYLFECQKTSIAVYFIKCFQYRVTSPPTVLEMGSVQAQTIIDIFWRILLNSKYNEDLISRWRYQTNSTFLLLHINRLWKVYLFQNHFLLPFKTTWRQLHLIDNKLLMWLKHNITSSESTYWYIKYSDISNKT